MSHFRASKMSHFFGVIGCRRRGGLTGSGGVAVGEVAGGEFRDGRVGRGRRERSDRGPAPDARAASPGRLGLGNRPWSGGLPRRNLPERRRQVAALPHPVAVPSDLREVAAVEQPIEDRRRHHLVRADRFPLLGPVSEVSAVPVRSEWALMSRKQRGARFGFTGRQAISSATKRAGGARTRSRNCAWLPPAEAARARSLSDR